MQALLSFITLFFLATGCQSSGSTVQADNDSLVNIEVKDTLPVAPIPRPYSTIEYEKKELITAAGGTKSVLFNSSGTKLYAMNLEGMSVYEFDQASRKLTREFKFTPTRGMGWDYNKSRPIASFQEKPVEACFSHDDMILWVSLHNADGIVPIWVNDFSKNNAVTTAEQKTKPVTVIYPGAAKKDSFRVPLIETGKTPKVISRTADSKYLLVSNWHSRNTSVLEMDENTMPYGKVISTIPTSAIPRGIAVDDKNKKSYIAIMGGASLNVVDNNTWKSESIMNVWSSPRHVVMDTSGHLFVSYNSLGTIACIDVATGKQLFSAKTHSQPRTIVLSKNHKFIFVTCYTSDYVDVYKINEDNFEKVASLPCGGHPVGADIYENDDKLEAWVCSYSSGSISIYTFKKK
ncbi:MAG: YncE family protein [Chitinophagaceae bacterium]|nr:YncE family protein [Chitinophagaceae bacterium]MBK8299370.1 YncE family protein [Chitinophagaceae bacterium]MBK9659458.1 YncE family protein [Chitinophagaceae bacterium]MBK9937013.1 YncE family protein [Chitinophagaceae bacterium]MBP6233355.1 YncE family protein [Chitinophagaceae bacterium]